MVLFAMPNEICNKLQSAAGGKSQSATEIETSRPSFAWSRGWFTSRFEFFFVTLPLGYSRHGNQANDENIDYFSWVICKPLLFTILIFFCR
jgi:hypothetical protein